MKKVAVATTTSRGAAVSRSSATAVQSVYIESGTQSLPILSGEPMALRSAVTTCWPGQVIAAVAAVAAVFAAGLPARAGVEFDNCQATPDGGVTCDTRPTGNTLADDEAARYGLFDEASPGWSEFDPYEGYDDMFGGNWT